MTNRRPPRTRFGTPSQPMRPTPNPKAAAPAGSRSNTKSPERVSPLAARLGSPPRGAPPNPRRLVPRRDAKAGVQAPPGPSTLGSKSEAATRARRALGAPQSPTRSTGDPTLCRLLETALDAPYAKGADPDTLTHGFHAYPARMHPAVARVLVEGVSERG